MTLILVERIEHRDRALVFEPPLVLPVTLEPEYKTCFMIEDLEMGLLAFGRTREKLEAELFDHLWFLWDSYVLEDPKKLTTAAISLCNKLRQRVREERK